MQFSNFIADPHVQKESVGNRNMKQ